MRAPRIRLELICFGLLSISLFPAMAWATSSGSNELPLSELRSAFLGPQQWGTQPLSREEADSQLRNHFALVLSILEEQTDASLRLAVERAEKFSGQRWSAFDRAACASKLASQRQSQLTVLAS